MTKSKRTAIWEAYADADFAHRYFLALKDKLSKRITYLSFCIAILSSGFLIQALFEFKIPEYIPTILGLTTAVLGLYLSNSSLIKQLSTASAASNYWNRTCNKYKTLWVETESGKDVWNDHLLLLSDIEFMDADVTNNLNTDKKIQELMELESNNFLTT